MQQYSPDTNILQLSNRHRHIRLPHIFSLLIFTITVGHEPRRWPFAIRCLFYHCLLLLGGGWCFVGFVFCCHCFQFNDLCEGPISTYFFQRRTANSWQLEYIKSFGFCEWEGGKRYNTVLKRSARYRICRHAQTYLFTFWHAGHDDGSNDGPWLALSIVAFTEGSTSGCLCIAIADSQVTFDRKSFSTPSWI